MLRWCERAAAAGLLWWLLTGCVGPPSADTRVTVRCGDQVRHVTVEYLRAHPACQLL